MSNKVSEKEIQKGFEEAYKKGELTDMMGNKLKGDDLIMYNVEGSKGLTFDQIIKVVKGLQGKVLTIVDATFTDEERKKYVKDLIRDSFTGSADWLFELSSDSITKEYPHN